MPRHCDGVLGCCRYGCFALSAIERNAKTDHDGSRPPSLSHKRLGWLIESFVHLFRGLEEGQAFAVNRDWFAGPRIAPVSRPAILDREHPKPPYLDPFAAAQPIHNRFEYRVNNVFDISLVKLFVTRMNQLYQIGFKHRQTLFWAPFARTFQSLKTPNSKDATQVFCANLPRVRLGVLKKHFIIVSTDKWQHESGSMSATKVNWGQVGVVLLVVLADLVSFDFRALLIN